MMAMKRLILIASVLAATLSANSRLAFSSLVAAWPPVAHDVSAELHRDSVARWFTTAAECSVDPSSAKFGSAEFGNSAHSRFGGALKEQTGTQPEHWFMRTDPGMTGVDATYIGPEELYPGFRHAELKPFGESGFNTFQRQLDNWGLPPGKTQLWWYNEHGIIGSSGTNW